ELLHEFIVRHGAFTIHVWAAKFNPTCWRLTRRDPKLECGKQLRRFISALAADGQAHMDQQIFFVLGTVFVLLFTVIYGPPAFSGVTKRRMTMRGLTSWTFRKRYDIEGWPAVLMGLFLLASIVLCIVGWAAQVFSIVVK
ncbi:MAG: hypothetical protein WCF84_22140, partial [Anaerolineae bacterium]